MSSAKASPEISFDDPGRYALTQRCTWISVAVNVLLTAAQVVAGIVANSQALVADGMHSLSDLVCDFLVLFAAHHSKDPADESHPYGHARIETAASFGLGAILAATGGAIIWSAGVKLQDLGSLPPVAPLALWTALLALVAKEGLFRYMLHVGQRLRSPMLIANAWHARSDAASSLVVAVGIGGNLMGFVFADSVAAVIVGFMIVRMGVVFSWEALQELIDTGLSVEEVASIRQVIIDTQEWAACTNCALGAWRTARWSMRMYASIRGSASRRGIALPRRRASGCSIVTRRFPTCWYMSMSKTTRITTARASACPIAAS
jgi:cation diffusion facilitator family transporter